MPGYNSIIALNAAVISAVLFAVGSQPLGSQRVMVISPKWLGLPGPVAVIAAADGAILEVSPSESVAVGVSTEPSFVRSLYSAGALLVWDGRFALGCNDKRN